MRATDMVGAHREPTPPAGIATGLREGPCLSHLTRMAQTTRAVVTLDHAGMDRLVTSPRQPVCQTGLAMNRPPLHLTDTPLLVVLVHLAIGPSLTPTTPRTTASTWGGVATTNDLPQRRVVTGHALGEQGWQRTRASTIRGLLYPGSRLIVGALAHSERAPPLAISRHGAMSPLITRLVGVLWGTTCLLLFTKDPGSSPSTARGVTPCPGGS